MNTNKFVFIVTRLHCGHKVYIYQNSKTLDGYILLLTLLNNTRIDKSRWNCLSLKEFTLSFVFF